MAFKCGKVKKEADSHFSIIHICLPNLTPINLTELWFSQKKEIGSDL